MPEEMPQLPVSEQETQIEAPSLIDKLKLQKKKILIGLGSVLGILVLSGAVFGVYKYAQRQISLEPVEEPTPTLVATPTPDTTANWETYTNTKYGYSIKYPSELGIKEKGKTDEKIVNLTLFILSGQQASTASIDVLSEPYQSVLSSLESEWWGGTLQSPNKVEDIVVAGIDAKRISGTQVPTGHDLFEVVFPKGNLTYRIFLFIGPEEKNLGFNELTFDLILSTFKFLGQNQTDETVNWETYRNEKYGFEIKYPPDWTADVQDSTVLFSENGPSGSRIGLNSPQKTMYGDPFWIHIYRISQVSEQTALDNFKIFHAGDPCLDCSTQEVRLGNEDFLRVTEQKGGYIGYIKIRNSKYFEISYEDPGVQKLNEQIEQILSTFKFLD